MKPLQTTREAAEEYSCSLSQIGEGWWRQIAWAHQVGIPKALGLTTRQWTGKYFNYPKLVLNERRKAIGELSAAGFSNRSIADVLGVDESTVRSDRAAGNPAVPSNGNQDNQPFTETPAGNPAQTEEQVSRAALDVRRCDFRELLSSLSDVDAIITDPPYDKSSGVLYVELARLARIALKPDGVLAVMTGQSYLPEVLPAMSAMIPYRWMMAYLTPGGQSPQIWPRKVNTFWKPVVLFGGVPKWIGDVIKDDVIKSDVNDNDKRFHEWGQSVSGTRRLVEILTEPDQLVCDPFCGGRTVGVVCQELGRRFIGGDVTG